ncbi:MAG: GNAT family N-acetyltransferase [Planctomycetota bacterium]|nr:MAG: GNAT family N-acetyltransferase [Planctomycetota bacterium]
MDDSLRVRRGSPDDAAWIRDCQLAMAQETEALALDAATVLRGVEHVLANPAIGFYVVAERVAPAAPPARVACALVLYEWSDWRARNVWWIHSVFVLPGERGGGVFSAMFRDVEREAAARGAPYLRLYVERENHRAQRVYEKLEMSDRHYAMYEKPIRG